MSRPAKAHINLDALSDNFRLSCELAPNSKSIAVVKANAYGHGAIECAKTLDAIAPALAVASIEEALELRTAGIQKPILLLEGPFTEDEIPEAEKHNLWLMLSNAKQVEWLKRSKLSSPMKIWLKADSGMHRLGFQGDDFSAAYTDLKSMQHVQDEIVLATHFAVADELDRDFTNTQITNFKAMLPSNQEPLSLANSSGILAWPESHAQWNRPGYMLYGATPLNKPHDNAKQLKPVMSLESEVIAVRDVPSGETVGYGCSWTAERPSKIATIAIGYGDGYPRQTPNGTPLLINGKRAKLAGRVSMDMITADVTDLIGTNTSVKIGDPVELWGNNLCVNEIAGYCDTIGYELLTRMPLRAKRIFK